MPNSIKDYRNMIEQPWGKMFYDIVHNQLNLQNDKVLNILDYGAGFCVTSNYYAKFHKVTAIEPNKNMLNLRIRENDFTLINADIKAIKDITDNSFDLIICHNVLEYVPNKELILTELARVLKKNGRLSIVKHNLAGKLFNFAVFDDNPESALKLLERSNDTEYSMFGNRDTYSNEYLIHFADKLGVTIDNIFGIRTFFALSSNNKIKYTDKWYANMLKLEMEVCNIPKYRDIAFFNHLIFTKH